MAGNVTYTVPSGCRLFGALTPGGSAMAAMFCTSQSNGLWDLYNYFIQPGTAYSGSTMPYMTSPLSYSSTDPAAFLGPSSLFAADSTHDVKYVYPRGGDGLAFTTGSATIGVDVDTQMPPMTMSEGLMTLEVLPTSINGSAAVYVHSRDDDDFAKQRSRLGINRAVQTGGDNLGLSLCRLPSTPGTNSSLNSIRSLIVPDLVPGATKQYYHLPAQLCKPQWWRSGYIKALGDTTGSTTEAESDMFANGNPFLAAAMGCPFFFVDANGADVVVMVTCDQRRVYEMVSDMTNDSAQMYLLREAISPYLARTVGEDSLASLYADSSEIISGTGSSRSEAHSASFTSSHRYPGDKTMALESLGKSSTQPVQPHSPSILDELFGGLTTAAHYAKEGVSVAKTVKGAWDDVSAFFA